VNQAIDGKAALLEMVNELRNGLMGIGIAEDLPPNLLPLDQRNNVDIGSACGTATQVRGAADATRPIRRSAVRLLPPDQYLQRLRWAPIR
jgi:hypothetical protein